MKLVNTVGLLAEPVDFEATDLDLLSIAGVSDIQSPSVDQPLEPTGKKKIYTNSHKYFELAYVMAMALCFSERL